MKESHIIKPKSVVIATNLLLGCIILNIIWNIYDVAIFYKDVPILVSILLIVLNTWLQLWLLLKLRDGHNWARNFISVMTIVYTILMVYGIMSSPIQSSNSLSIISSGITLVILIISNIFLFKKESSDYFIAMSNNIEVENQRNRDYRFQNWLTIEILITIFVGFILYNGYDYLQNLPRNDDTALFWLGILFFSFLQICRLITIIRLKLAIAPKARWE